MPKTFDALVVIDTGQSDPPHAVRLHRGRHVPGRDQDISNAVRDILIKEGIQLTLNAECIELFGAVSAKGARTSSPDVRVVHGTQASYGDYEIVAANLLYTYTPQSRNSSRPC